VIPGHHHHDRPWNRARQPCELIERVDDRRVHRANGVENISGENHHVGLERYDPVDRAPERVRHVSLSLIDARLRQTVVLTETEMQIGDVNQAHATLGEDSANCNTLKRIACALTACP
jgi:hypothetical protein